MWYELQCTHYIKVCKYKCFCLTGDGGGENSDECDNARASTFYVDQQESPAHEDRGQLNLLSAAFEVIFLSCFLLPFLTLFLSEKVDLHGLLDFVFIFIFWNLFYKYLIEISTCKQFKRAIFLSCIN